MDYQIRKRLIHEAIQRPCTGTSGYGDKLFDPDLTLPCFRSGKETTVRNLHGVEVVSALQLYFDGILTVSGNDEFIFKGKTYQVLSYSHYDGLRANTGTTVVYL